MIFTNIYKSTSLIHTKYTFSHTQIIFHKNCTSKILSNQVIRLEVQNFIEVSTAYVETEPNHYWHIIASARSQHRSYALICD